MLDKLAILLSPRQRWRAFRHGLVILVFAVVEVIWIGAIYELVTLSTQLLSGQDLTPKQVHIAFFRDITGFREPRELLAAIAFAVMAVIVLRSFFGVFITWQRSDFVKRLESELMGNLLASYMSQDYVYHLRANSSTLAKNILNESSILVSNTVMAMLMIVTDSLVGVAILAFLLSKEPVATVVALSAIALGLAAIYGLSRRQMRFLGANSRVAEEGRFRIVQEALAGIKDVKVYGRERRFLNLFNRYSEAVAGIMVGATMLKESPRYAVETLAFLLLIGVIVSMILGGGGAAEISGALALFGISGFRLMPIAFRIYKSFGDMRFSTAIIESTCRDLALARRLPDANTHASPIGLDGGIRFEGVCYRYPDTERDVVRNLGFTIRKNSSIALVGATGAGKSTIADLILGLIEPTKGRILIGETPLTGDAVAAFRRNIGYVAQHIFLSDASIRFNIAFGVPDEEIDDSRVRRAASAAHLDEFVDRLPLKYDTEIGERGVRLSGGQRQRIGIARALYRDPEFLIFDEATSALDGVTESIITDAMQEFSGAKTVVIIAHRLSTVQRCDRIHLIEHGRMVAEGSYEELLAGSASFRAMAGTASF